jgi:hypothetical protein
MPHVVQSDFWSIYRHLLWHWHKSNDALAPAGPLVLGEKVAQADAAAILLAYESAQDAEAALQIDDRLLRGQEQELRAAAAAHVLAFNAKVRAALGPGPYARLLVTPPQSRAGRATLLHSLRATATLWEKIEAAPAGSFQPPLILRDGTTRAAFTSRIAALEAVLDLREAVALDRDLQRAGEAARRAFGGAWIPAYRAALPALLRAGHPLVATLPAYSPAEAPRPAGPPRRRGRPPKGRKKRAQ